MDKMSYFNYRQRKCALSDSKLSIYFSLLRLFSLSIEYGTETAKDWLNKDYIYLHKAGSYIATKTHTLTI